MKFIDDNSYISDLEKENKKLKLILEEILEMQQQFYTEGVMPYKRLHPDLVYWSAPLSVVFNLAYAAVNDTEQFRNMAI